MSELVVDRAGATRRGSKRSSSIIRPALAAVALAVAYYLGARIGFALTFQPHPVSTLWPPNSILLAALLLAPRRWWWFLILSVLPAHLFVQFNAGVPAPMVFCWFISNSSEALIGAALIRYLTDGPVLFDSIRRVAIFIFGALTASFLSSFLDAGFVILNKWGNGEYWEIWQMRFFANVLTELTLVPLIVMWWREGISSLKKASLRRYAEAAVLAFGLLLIGLFVFAVQRAGFSNIPALLYTPLPLLLWAAVRFGPRGVSTSLMGVTFLAIWGAINGLGPFVTRSPEENALSVQLFLILISLPLLFLAALILEQQKVRETARKNEEQLAIALSAAEMGTWDWHIQKGEAKWSDETKRMFGFLPTDQEATPQVFYSMLHPDDQDFVEQAINRSISKGTPYEAEFRMSQPDGSFRWVRGKGKVLCDEAGKPLRMVGINADITKRKHFEQALRESEDRYRSMVESQTELICRFLPDTTLTYVNDAYCRYFKKSREELIGTRFLSLLPEHQRSWATEVFASLVLDPRTETHEQEVMLPDGSSGWQQWINHAIPGPDGKIVELQAIGRDITERKRAEQALHETLERNRAMLRALPDLVFLISRKGIYLDYHVRDRDSLLVQPDDFLGKSVREVLPAELAERVMYCLGRAAITDGPQVLEYSLSLNGEERYYEARIICMDEEKTLSIVRDVTDRRRATAALSQSQEQLRQSHRQISALAGRLITAQEAERRRISRHLHDDLSQKIATLSVAISKLKRALPTSDEHLKRELDQLRELTNELTTDIRRLSHQLHPAVLEHLGLVSALESYISEFRNEEQIDVTLTSRLGSERIPLDVSVCLYRVAVEALRNVARHSGASAAQILLEKENHSLRLEVSDPGRGFDLQTAVWTGGLGLLSLEERVRLLDGDFEVKSQPDKGTTLFARIPWAGES